MTPASRSLAHRLAKTLHSAAEPVYVLDAQRRLAFVNEACRQWLGPEVEEALDQPCAYHSEPDSQGQLPLAALLCPPPEVFAGQQAAVRSIVRAIPAAGDREVLFIPLAQESGGLACVLAIVARDAATCSDAIDGQADDAPRALHARLARFRQQQQARFRLDRLVGDVPAMRRVRSQVEVAANSDASVLIVGPVGSGRQHVARTIHVASAGPSHGPLVPLACPVLGAELLQTTIRSLARSQRESTAPFSTLLLNDVDQMPPEAQAELAGFLRLTELPIRLLATARAPLVELALGGTFRSDLAHWLSTLVIALPRLVERLADLPLLAQMFLEQENARASKQLSGLTSDALDALAGYAWPGEVDELAATVAQSHAQATGSEITVRDLPQRIFLAASAERYARLPETTIVLDEFLERIERELVERALLRSKGNKTRAAGLLGMTRPRLYRRLVQLGLVEEGAEVPQFEEVEEDDET